jgi:hypothetical protein
MKDTTTHIALLYAGTLVLCVAVLVLILIGIEVNQEASEVRARVHELEDRVHRLKRQSKKEQEGGELLIIPGSVMEQNQFCLDCPTNGHLSTGARCVPCCCPSDETPAPATVALLVGFTHSGRTVGR